MATVACYVLFGLLLLNWVHSWVSPVILPQKHQIASGKASYAISNKFDLRMSAAVGGGGDDGTQYTVTLGLPPLGIVFEEIPPIGRAGVQVIALTSGGKGERCGKINIGDRLKSTTAVKFQSGSANYNLVDVDCTQLDFDTVVSAIGSNQEKFKCDSVEMTFIRPDAQTVQESMDDAEDDLEKES